jgi:uncharacterized protein
MIHLTMLITV